MMEKFEDDSSTPITSSYDSRSRFIRNAEAKQHGISQRTSYSYGGYRYGRNAERKPQPSIIYALPVENKYMQRKRNNSVCLQKSAEVKYIDDNTLLLKVTCDFYNMQEAGNGNSRWSYTEADATYSIQNGEPFKQTSKLFLIQADASLKIKAHKDHDNILVIGASGDSTKTTSGIKTEFKDSKDNKLIVVELLGANAKIWDEQSEEKIAHILNPTIVEYTSPTFEEMKRDGLLKSVRQGEPIAVNNLMLYKIADEAPLSVSTGKLTTALDISELIIRCKLCKGAVLTYTDYTENGEVISRDVEPGIYNITLSKMNSKSRSLSKYRQKVMEAAEQITVDFTVNRFDFLTALDVETDKIKSEDSGLKGRVDAGASISIDSDAKSVNTDNLVNRVSFVNLDED